MANRKLAHHFLNIPRPAKRLLAMLVDGLGCYITLKLALLLRLEQWVPFQEPHWLGLAVAFAISMAVFQGFGLYAAIFRYAGWGATVRLAKACALYGVLFMAVFTVYGVAGMPRTVGVIQPLLMFVYVAASRLAVRLLLGDLYRAMLRQRTLPGLLIYGAGKAGHQLAASVRAANGHRLLGFLDDDARLQGRSIDMLPVHAPQAVGELVHTLQAKEIVLAMPTISRVRKAEIVEQLRPYRVRVRTLPDITRLPMGQLGLSDVQDLDIEELLGRDPVPPEPGLLHKLVQGRVVLVTGAGGSIGSELCRQIASLQPHTLVMLDSSEHALYQIAHELGNTHPTTQRVALLGSVADERRMASIMQTWQPHTVYHAAAYKHVPLVEHNMVEGVRNNVWGTWVTARCALAAGVGHFVLVSTDKAVRPTNVMGASKRLCEMVLQALAKEHAGRTCFTMVRFGNVLGSSGSVVPLFRRQIAQGGPVTLTHPDITRYFMTIPEAAELVLQAAAMASGGDVFVLDMGAPVRISDLARRMVQLSGFTVREADFPGGDIEIQTTGLRPGEKLYEELLIGDNTVPTGHARIMCAHEHFLPWAKLQGELSKLVALLDAEDHAGLRQALQRIVTGYMPDDALVDWAFQARNMTVDDGLGLLVPAGTPPSLVAASSCADQVVSTSPAAVARTATLAVA